MKTIEFRVQGSAPAPYTVTFLGDAGATRAVCTCPAGEVGQICKHRIALLRGQFTHVLGADPSLIASLGLLLEGSELVEALSNLDIAEADLESAKKSVQNAKKRLARLMQGG